MCEAPPSACCDSMAGIRSGCRFYTNALQATARIGLFAFFVSKSDPRVELVEVSLEALLGFFRQAREFNPHPDTGIAGTNHSGGCQALLFDPQVHPERGTDG